MVNHWNSRHCALSTIFLLFFLVFICCLPPWYLFIFIHKKHLFSNTILYFVECYLSHDSRIQGPTPMARKGLPNRYWLVLHRTQLKVRSLQITVNILGCGDSSKTSKTVFCAYPLSKSVQKKCVAKHPVREAATGLGKCKGALFQRKAIRRVFSPQISARSKHVGSKRVTHDVLSTADEMEMSLQQQQQILTSSKSIISTKNNQINKKYTVINWYWSWNAIFSQIYFPRTFKISVFCKTCKFFCQWNWTLVCTCW